MAIQDEEDMRPGLAQGLLGDWQSMLGLAAAPGSLGADLINGYRRYAGPPSGASTYVAADEGTANPFGHASNPRLTPQNVERFARILQAECGGICQAPELQGVGSTILNRMNRQKTDSVLAAAPNGQYAVSKESPSADKIELARLMLSGKVGDNTGGATHFYSPRSMPAEGSSMHGYDTAGGIEDVPTGTDKPDRRSYRPGFAVKYPQNSVEGVRDFYFKFYTEPAKGHQ